MQTPPVDSANNRECESEDTLSLVSEEVKARASKIKLILMDVDGVLTDGKLFYFPGPDGQTTEFKGFNSQDGLGFHMLHWSGIKTGLISGRDSPAVTERSRILNITYVYQGFLQKIATYEEILQKENLTDESVAFIGDDFTDFPLIKRSGLGVCVADGRPEMRARADYVTRVNGGSGALREVAEIVLKTRGLWQPMLAKYGFVD